MGVLKIIIMGPIKDPLKDTLKKIFIIDPIKILLWCLLKR